MIRPLASGCVTGKWGQIQDCCHSGSPQGAQTGCCGISRMLTAALLLRLSFKLTNTAVCEYICVCEEDYIFIPLEIQ